MTREELIKKVALKMDEISSSDDVIVAVDSSDNNPLYTQINGLLNESINDVLTKAPIYRINNRVTELGTATLENTPDKNRKVAVFSVPSDFIRLVSITHTDFQRPIVDLAIEGDDVDKRQHNRHLIAKCAKPVGVIGRAASGRVIRCYSLEKDETIPPTGLYIERYDSDKRDTTVEVGLDDYLIDIVSWTCAGRVFSAQGDVNKGKACDENAASLMI
jgi:hypothetical protein